MTDTNDRLPKLPAWAVVALLVAMLVAAIVAGALRVIGEENTARLMLGTLALLVWVVTRRPPGDGGALAAVVPAILALGAGELGAQLGGLP